MVKVTRIKKFFKKKKILITGNTGFIGSWLTLIFLNYGANVTGISKDLGSKNGIFNIFKLKNKIKFYKFDLTDEFKTNKFFKNKKYDIIIHLAAEPLIIDGHLKPSKIIKNNILSTLNLIQNINNSKTYFINFTTDKVYFNNNSSKNYFKEDNYLYGDDPYSYSKVCVDMMTKMWVNNFLNLRCVNIRCGNVIGGGDWSHKRIIPDLMESIFKKKKLVLRSPKSTRPWVHIYEVCFIVLYLIYKNYGNKKIYEDFNISPNKNEEKNVLWIVNFYQKLSKIKINFSKKFEFKEKINLKLNNSKIKKNLMLKYKFNFRDRFLMTYYWYKFFYKTKKKLIDKTYDDLAHFENIFFKK